MVFNLFVGWQFSLERIKYMPMQYFLMAAAVSRAPMRYGRHTKLAGKKPGSVELKKKYTGDVAKRRRATSARGKIICNEICQAFNSGLRGISKAERSRLTLLAEALIRKGRVKATENVKSVATYLRILEKNNSIPPMAKIEPPAKKAKKKRKK